MTATGDLHDLHATHGAVFADRDGRRVVSHYGRPERAHLAVRNAVGVTDRSRGVVVVEGPDRVEHVDDVVSTPVPRTEGEGRYALLLDPRGAVETDMYVYDAGDSLLVVCPPDRAPALASDWGSQTFLRDVTVRDATDDFAVFGVHGPAATEKVASVLDGPPPEDPLSFVRGSIRDAGVTVVATDAPTGEEGYDVVSSAADAADVMETLLVHGLNAVPFGRQTWETLTLEAGTPLLETELAGRIPNVCGVRNAYALDEGCFVGQEVVARVANRGRPSRRLVGLALPSDRPVPDRGATVVRAGEGEGEGEDADAVGEVTRAADAPSLDHPVAFAVVDGAVPDDDPDLAVRVDGEAVPATRADLPFVDGSARSARVPDYE